MNFDIDYLRSQLNDVQYQAVLGYDGPQLLLAGAGSGKTRVLTYKLASLVRNRGVAPHQVLAVTFTNKAAREMKTRVAKILETPCSFPWLGTFHSVCARILRMYAEHLGYTSSFTIYDRDDQKRLVKKILKQAGDEKIKPESVIYNISNFKNNYISFDGAAAMASGGYDLRIAKYYSQYQKGLKANNAMDFDDLIFLTISLLKQQEEVRERFKNSVRYVLIDEFQDTNKAQFQLIQLLLGPHNNITVVGDDDQSIYGWRGAEVTNILNFGDYFSNLNTVKMEQNYRSTKNILGVASSVIKHNRERHNKTIWTANDDGEKIVLLENENENQEAEKIIRQLKNDDTFSNGETAIFYRTNAQSRVLEDQLRRHNIPYMVLGGIRFYDRKEVKDVLAYLHVLVNPKDSVSFGRIINTPRRGIGNKTIEMFTDMALQNNTTLFEAFCTVENAYNGTAAEKKIASFLKIYRALEAAVQQESSLAEKVDAVIELSGYHAFLKESGIEDDRDRLENVAEFVAAAADFENRNPGKGLAEFLQEISLYTQEDEVKVRQSSVTLMTVHSAKGLEFSRVFLTGLEDGLFPLIRDADNADIEEERRLFYVAVTRAEKKLVLSFATSRRTWGNAVFADPSRFINEIEPHFLTRETGMARVTAPKTGRHYEPVEDQYIPNYEEECEGPAFFQGQHVQHKLFGMGTILKTEGFGESARLVIRFQDGNPKKMIPKFAKLTVLD
ncbi:MAG: UvrD-helicase domain-containing protein [Fibrobacteria bacterium]|nr:UvrD-helicase domain-containing protein [Fibrobacteria bacterium]